MLAMMSATRSADLRIALICASPRNWAAAGSRSLPLSRCSTAERPCHSSHVTGRRRPGPLDDAQLRTLEERLRYLRELDERRAAILESISQRGKLDAALKHKIEAADSKARLEDLYLPF